MSQKKVPVTITYASAGVGPPVFLAGSFSDPMWHPQEMNYVANESGEYEFNKEVTVEEGSRHQYKFRIGSGDWWALNEKAPTVTDDIGNRNNLLAVPISEESFSESSHSDFVPTPPESQSSPPEAVVQILDSELSYGDDFDDDATTGQRTVYRKKGADAQPDHVAVRSETGTPQYASTAAEVADWAAILDREPSPVPTSDEDAGRTGERRLSHTPIPQVALTAAEVADSAAIIDKDDMRINLSGLQDIQDNLSILSTPGNEKAPLFAHECLDLSDVIDEIPPHETYPEEAEKKEGTDPNDPLLEEFPSDRRSILAHVRSTESRLSEDETNVDGVPPSPISKPKSRSPSLDAPPSTRLDAQPSPQLEVIPEEYQGLGGDFSKLPTSILETESKDIEESSVTEGEEKTRQGKNDEKSTHIEKAAEFQYKRQDESMNTNELVGVESSGKIEEPDKPDTKEATNAIRTVIEEPKGIENVREEIDNQEEAKLNKQSDRLDKNNFLEVTAKTQEGHGTDEQQGSSMLRELIESTNSVTPEHADEAKDTIKSEEVAEESHNLKVAVGYQGNSSRVYESQHKDGPKQAQEIKESDTRQSSAIINAAVLEAAVGGVLIGGLVSKDSPEDPTLVTHDVQKTPDIHHALSDHVALENSAHIPVEITKNSPFVEGAAPNGSKVAVSKDATVTISPQLPPQNTDTYDTEIGESDEPLLDGADTAKSTSVKNPNTNGNSDSRPKMRNIPTSERSLTPTSIHSPIKNSESHNFFRAIWRTVFVGWIGGFFARLWGGGSGSLLALSAIVLLAAAPAVYFAQLV